MPIKVNPDGSFTCDTPEEAVQVQRLMLSKNGVPQPLSNRYGAYAAAAATVLSKPAVSTSTQTFLNQLHKYQGKSLDSEDMAKLLGTNTAMGVGPRLRSVRNSLEQQGSSLDSYLQPQKNQDGTTSWVVLASTEKSG